MRLSALQNLLFTSVLSLGITTTATTADSLTAPAIFYPFGSAAGDTNNPADDDGSSPVIQLSSSFLFFGHSYQNISVNNNGFFTFNQTSSEYVPYSFPANRNQDIIAGLWTDLDNRVKGVVSYQQYINGGLLTNATRDIKTYFPDLNFNASWVFVATWDKVAYFPKTNTETSFQIVLISGGNYSFILMNYGDIAVTTHPVQAGYDTINSTNYFVIPGSNLSSFISNLRNSSNVGVPGRWVFRVDSEPGNSIFKNNVLGIRFRLSSFSDVTQSGNSEQLLQQIKQELVKYGLPNSVELKLRKTQKINP
ncbi:sushi, nidogen and EGF-like domain-containing protein 1 [Puntigrus tetrazona]|uniref:sushi, nidogen and EGF-like domain-containing protein 1 n=1 Tax=Puntigrus tetrazona TaxID=1606681 RepID=UPI001C8B0366|nr:sushi, nidogen and EGF-like domain-containing protein 1 [Puntigrus tetrazona]XP_043109123.1 sushi, nidogen and EGF-like domain-containing protein 1 [Puntigrus tetrazona]